MKIDVLKPIFHVKRPSQMLSNKAAQVFLALARSSQSLAYLTFWYISSKIVMDVVNE